MNEPKIQIRIIAALLLAVISLGIGLFFYGPFSPHLHVNGELNKPTEQTHQKIRDSAISLEPSLDFTQTFGGSLSEDVIDVFYRDERLYVFGNTQSSDYDFENSGAYLAILGKKGNTLGFFTYKGTLVAVTLSDNGFILALNRDDYPIAYAIDLSGNEIESLALPCVRKETALDVKFVDGGYLFVTALTQEITTITRLKLTALTNELKFSGSVVTDEVYSLQYVDTFDVMGKYYLVANALSDIRNMLCVGEWNNLAFFPKEFSYTVNGLWITNKTYYLATTSDKTALICDDGKIIELCQSSQSPTISGENGYVYVSAGENFYCTKGDSTLFSAQYGKTDLLSYGDKLYTVSTANSRVCIRTFFMGSKTYENSFSYYVLEPKLFICSAGMYVFGYTYNDFGDQDVTIIKVKY